MLWIIFGCMLFVAVLIVVVPLYKSQKSLSATAIASVVTVTAIAAIIYAQIGTPTLPTDAAESQSVEAMVASLAARLQENPNDIEGWKMLGRSYLQLKDFSAGGKPRIRAKRANTGRSRRSDFAK
jgi:cytochrome c-type biogenesis protein CcmH